MNVNDRLKILFYAILSVLVFPLYLGDYFLDLISYLFLI